MDTPETMAAALVKAAMSAVAVTEGVVTKGAVNVKNQAKRNVQASAPTHNAYAHNAIDYDTGLKGTVIEAEIGYNKDKRGGSLGNLLEYGSRNNAPHRDLGRALDAEERGFPDHLAAAIAKLL